MQNVLIRSLRCTPLTTTLRFFLLATCILLPLVRGPMIRGTLAFFTEIKKLTLHLVSAYSSSTFVTMVWVCAPAVAVTGNCKLPVIR